MSSVEDSSSMDAAISSDGNTLNRNVNQIASSLSEQNEITASGRSAQGGRREPVHSGSHCKLFRNGYLHHADERTIYDGFFNRDVPVAIVRMQCTGSEQREKEIAREFRLLQELKAHENFIRYFTREIHDDFVYVATELCICSVADLLNPGFITKESQMKQEILDELKAKDILRQATRGLNFLHEHNFVHRNIKPNNFLIKEVNKSSGGTCRFLVKITDFRLTRKFNPEKEANLSGSAASEKWEAPESLQQGALLSTKLDVFILGCFYHYVLIALSTNENNIGKPRHPFGEAEFQRRSNICNENYSVYKDSIPFVASTDDEQKAAELIKGMLKHDAKERPTLKEVLGDDYFHPSKDYNIYGGNKIPGLCVIFNQQKFENEKQNRDGSDKDVEKLKYTFNMLGFNTEVHENLTSLELKSEVKSLAERNFKNYGCLIVCLLSHGIENAIQCYEGKCVNVNELKHEFSLNTCPSLYGKPKIFIVQCCQESVYQDEHGMVSLTDNPSFVSNLSPLLCRNCLSTTDQQQLPSVENPAKKEININGLDKMLRNIIDNPTKNPPLMDFITIKASLPGFVSYRSPTDGTWFIQALCQILCEEYLEKKPNSSTVDGIKLRDLEGILRGESGVQSRVNEISEEYFQLQWKNKFGIASKENRIKFWQTVSWEACLGKYIRFRGDVTRGTNIHIK